MIPALFFICKKYLKNMKKVLTKDKDTSII